jgi:hypothetical protein
MAGTCRCYRMEARVTPPEVKMSTMEFFDYLVASEATHDLGLSLVDVFADRVLPALDFAA